MSKFTPNTFTNLNNETSFINQLNANFSTLQTLLDTMVSRDGTSPNTLTADLDVNSQDILNANNAYVQTLFINGTEVVPTDLANVPATEIPVGTVGAPGLAVDGDADTGFFQDTLNTLAISIGGSEVFRAKSTGIDVVGDVICTDDMSCDRITAASMTITTGGLVISAGGLNVTGTVTLPSHTLANGTVATTQSASDNSTKVATTAYVDTAIAAIPGASTVPHARARRNATQTLATTTWTLVEYDTEDWDTTTSMDVATNKGRFTVPTTGYYRVSARVVANGSDLLPSTTKIAAIAVYVNGSAVYTKECVGAYLDAQATTNDWSIEIDHTISVSATNYIEVYVYQNSTKTHTIQAGTSKTFVTIDRLT